MQIAHDRRGSGEPMVLVHGIGSWRGMWEPVVDDLARGFDVIAVDLPGFGDSPDLPEGAHPDPAGLATAVADGLAALGVERAHWVGNSLGGAVALEAARQRRALTVTALSPGGFGLPRERAYAGRVLRHSRTGARRLAPLADRLCATAPGRRAAIGLYVARPARMPAAAAAESVRQLAGCRGFEATLATLDDQFRGGGDLGEIPVTIAWGTRDYLLLPRQGPRAARAIPGARLVPLRGLGHIPTFDDPARVAQVIAAGARPS